MFNIEKICVIGGDRRQVYLGELLSADGKFVTFCALEKCAEAAPDYSSMRIAISKCDSVILPMPLSKDGITLNTPLSDTEITLNEEFAEMLRGKRVFCANSAQLKKTGDYSDVFVYDYLAREELAVENAVPTAEGAIAAAIDNTDITLHSSRCLVAGFGRIGKLLARDLKALGADVTVSARKPHDLAWISSCGYTAVKTNEISESGSYDIIFNTIPSMIFDRDVLSRTAANAVVIDLASKPGGIDLEACKDLGIKAFAALSLPGKTAPRTAARIIKDTIYNIVREVHP